MNPNKPNNTQRDIHTLVNIPPGVSIENCCCWSFIRVGKKAKTPAAFVLMDASIFPRFVLTGRAKGRRKKKFTRASEEYQGRLGKIKGGYKTHEHVAREN